MEKDKNYKTFYGIYQKLVKLNKKLAVCDPESIDEEILNKAINILGKRIKDENLIGKMESESDRAYAKQVLLFNNVPEEYYDE